MEDRNVESFGDEFVELFAVYKFTDADIAHDVLAEAGIATQARNLAPAQFPISVGKHGQVRIAVERHNLEQARALLVQALEDGAISDESHFL
jgi:hypothetical protein